MPGVTAAAAAGDDEDKGKDEDDSCLRCAPLAVPFTAFKLLQRAGEGIHTAMMGGKAAAQTILDMRRTGDFSKQSCKVFERR